MNTLVRCVFLIAAMTEVRVLAASPVAYYNPATGYLTLSTDLGFRHGLNIVSTSSQLTTDVSAYNQIPGATLDTSDLPYAAAYYGVSLGRFDIGTVVTPRTPVDDLSLQWFGLRGALDDSFGHGFVIQVPEPCGLALVAMFAPLLRRPRRTRKSIARRFA